MRLGDDFHERVRQGFLTEARQQPNMRVIDGTRAEAAVHAQIIEEVSRVVAARPRT